MYRGKEGQFSLRNGLDWTLIVVILWSKRQSDKRLISDNERRLPTSKINNNFRGLRPNSLNSSFRYWGHRTSEGLKIAWFQNKLHFSQSLTFWVFFAHHIRIIEGLIIARQTFSGYGSRRECKLRRKLLQLSAGGSTSAHCHAFYTNLCSISCSRLFFPSFQLRWR